MCKPKRQMRPFFSMLLKTILAYTRKPLQDFRGAQRSRARSRVEGGGRRKRQKHYPLRHGTYCRFTQAVWVRSKLVSQRINLSQSCCSFLWFNVISVFFKNVSTYLFREHPFRPFSSLRGSVAMVASFTLFSWGWHNNLAQVRDCGSFTV